MASSSQGKNPLKVWLEERPLATAVALGFSIWVVLLLLAQVLVILVLILVAFILAAIMMPIVRFVRRARLPPRGWQLPKWLIVLLIYAALAAAAAFLAFLTAQIVIPQLTNFVTSLPQLLQGFMQQIDQLRESAGLTGVIPSAEELMSRVQGFVGGLVAAPGQLERIVGSIFWFFFGLFFVLILALFLIVESEPIMDFWVGLWPPPQRPQVRRTTILVGQKVGYWILAQLAVATIIGILAGLGSWALGLQYPILLGAGTALMDLAPIVGPSVMAIPAGLMGLARSPLLAALAVLLFYGLSFIEGHILAPLITSRFVRLRVTLVLIAVPIGLVLYGPIGAVVAIPVTAGLVVITNEVLLPWLREQEGIPPEEREDERRRRAA